MRTHCVLKTRHMILGHDLTQMYTPVFKILYSSQTHKEILYAPNYRKFPPHLKCYYTTLWNFLPISMAFRMRDRRIHVAARQPRSESCWLEGLQNNAVATRSERWREAVAEWRVVRTRPSLITLPKNDQNVGQLVCADIVSRLFKCRPIYQADGLQ